MIKWRDFQPMLKFLIRGLFLYCRISFVFKLQSILIWRKIYVEYFVVNYLFINIYFSYNYYDNDYGNSNSGVTSPHPTNMRPMPVPTHTSIFDEALQTKFDQLVTDNNRTGLEELLRSYSNSIDINKLDRASGQTPLQTFCVNGDLALVQLMVRYGADTQLRSRDGWAAVHYATFSGVQDVLLYVIRCSSRR